MATRRIKGLSIILGADADPAVKALGEIDKASRDTYRELGQVNRQLKFEPGNAELLAQKQQLLTQHVEATSDRLKVLREAQEGVNKRFEEGEITVEQHRDFQRELIKTESMLKNYEGQLKKVNFESDEFRLVMAKVGKTLDDAGKKMNQVGGALTKGLTAPAVAGATALGALATKGAKVADRLDKTSQKMGITTTAMQEMEYWADQNGMSADTLERAIGRLNQRIGLAAGGNDKYSQGLKALGVDMEGVKAGTVSTEDAMVTAIQTLSEMTSEQEKSAVAADLFGTKLARDLMPTLGDTALSIEEAREKAHELGLVLDKDAIDAGVRFNDMMTDLKRSISTAVTEIGLSLAPTFEALSETIMNKVAPAIRGIGERINNLVTWYQNLNPAIQNAIKVITAFAISIGPVLKVVGTLTSGIGAVVTALGTAVAFIKVSVIPAITAMNLPLAVLIGAIGGVAVVAYEVYRAWDEVKGALTATWEYLKAQGESLGISISIAMEKMKHATLSAVNEMLSRLSVLEKLPFGVGEKFTGLAEGIGDSVDKSKAKILELEAASKQNSERIRTATDDMKLAWGDVGQKIADDIALLISKIKGSGDVTEEEMQTITTTVKKNLDAQHDLYEEHYEEVEDLADEHADKRADFEEQWNRKLFDLTADRRAKLKKEYEDALELAKEYRADTLAIEKWYSESKKLLDKEERDARIKYEQGYQIKLKELLGDELQNKLDALDREEEEALKRAKELEADITAVKLYYSKLRENIAKEERDRLDAIAEKDKDTRERIERDFNRKLLEQTSTRLDLIRRQYLEQLKIAEDAGADTLAITKYYNNLILEEEERLEKERKAKQEEEKRLEQAKEDERDRFESDWAKRAREQSGDRLDVLRREYLEELKLAEDKEADTANIVKYFEAEITKEKERQIKERERMEQEADDKRKARQKEIADFEKSWSDKLFDLTATPEMQIERLEQEAKDMQELAEKMDASAETIMAIQEYYAQRQVEIQEQIANENLTLWERMAQALDDPLESLQEKLIEAGAQIAQFAEALSEGDFKSAFVSILLESEVFAKGLEIVGKVMKPVVTLFDNVLKPIINFIVGAWNAIMRGLSSISIFGWKPFGGLEKNIIDPIGAEDAGKGKSGGSGGGTQYAQFSGPDRDFLVDRLSGLSALPQIVAPIQDIRNMLANHLPNLATAGAGGGIVFEPGAIVIDGNQDIDDISRELVDKIVDELRGRGGNW